MHTPHDFPPHFSAVIFDLDGTLLYTLEEIATACNVALSKLGHPTHAVEAYCHFIGGGARKLAWRVLPQEQQNQQTYDALLPVLYEEFERVLNTIARPYDGVLHMLAAFAGAGKKLAVLSNKPDAFTKLAVRTFMPDVDFVVVQGGRDDVPLKPDPQSALHIAATMGSTPEQTLFVGDSDVDMHTANNAEMIPVGAAWGFRGAEELTNANARLVLHAPADLLTLL